MSTRLSDPARTILEIIRSLQHEGRPRYTKSQCIIDYMVFPCVPKVFIIAELYDKGGFPSMKKHTIDMAIIELQTNGYIEDAGDKTLMLMGKYIREDGTMVSVVECEGVKGGPWYEIMVAKWCACGVRLGAVVAYIITPTGLAELSAAGSSATLNDTERSIVEALRKAGHRMTTVELLTMATGATTGNGKAALASLVKRKILDNRQDTKPKGYGLPEWE